MILSVVHIEGCKADSGTYHATGGGIALYGGSLFMSGGVVRGCVSDSSWGLAAGGGLAVSGNGGANLLHAAVEHCHATSRLREALGGGIKLDGGWLSLEAAVVASCSAYTTGEGIRPWDTSESDRVSRGGGLAITSGGARLLRALPDLRALRRRLPTPLACLAHHHV